MLDLLCPPTYVPHESIQLITKILRYKLGSYFMHVPEPPTLGSFKE
jgi:hypothetical protein